MLLFMKENIRVLIYIDYDKSIKEKVGTRKD